MIPVSDAWDTAFLTSGVAPIFLVEVIGPRITARWATRAFGPYEPLRIGPGLMIGQGMVIGGTVGSYTTSIAQNGLSDLTQDMDDETGLVRVGNVTVELINLGLLSRTLLNTIENAAVRIRLLAKGPLGHRDALPLFFGFADQPTATYSRMSITLLHGAFRWHRDLTQAVDVQTFPTAPSASRGEVIPLLVGRNIDVEAVQIAGDAVGHLAFTCSSSAVTCDLTEYAAPFPISGEITLGTESGVTYSGRLIVEIDGVSYLRLTGLTRGAPVNQSAGATVTRTSVTYDYLLGYQVGDLLNVREDGALIDPGDYTFVPIASLPNTGSVAIVQFAVARTGTITFDCEGGNLQNLDTITNGSWETGDNTGWTASSGAGIAVTTTDPDEGTYKLELSGGASSDESNSQMIATQPNRHYTLLLSHRDQDASLDENLLAGGLLANAADLLMWTIVYVAPQTTYGIVSDPYTNVAFLAVSDGTSSNAGGVPVQSYQMILTSTATTVVSTDYLVTIRYAALITFILGLGSGGVVGGTPALGAMTITLDCGTAVDPLLYFSVSLSDAGVAYKRYEQEFTASGTTTQIRLTLSGIGVDNAPAPQARIAFVTLAPSAAAGHSISSVQIGTEADPDAYINTTLDYESGTWFRDSLAFLPTTSQTQITLLSQYNNAAVAVASEYDAVSLAITGRNPVDVIRYIIEEYVPGLGINETSFQTAYAARATWRFGGEFRPPGNSRGLLDRLADQCACRRFENGDGECVLVPWDFEAPAVYGFDRSNILLTPDVRVASEPADNVYTDIYVYYNLRAGTDRSDSGNYGGVVYATPDGTTHPTQALDALCDAAASSYQRRRVRRIAADAIQDQTTAHLLLVTLVQQHAIRTQDVTFATHLHAATLQTADTIAIDHPLIDGVTVLAEVLGTRLRPSAMAVELLARVKRVNGVEWGWEPPVEVISVGTIWGWEGQQELLSDGVEYGWEAAWLTAEAATNRRRRLLVDDPPVLDETIQRR